MTPKQTRSVLIVEDEGITADHLERDLRSSGFQVAGIASSGEQAVRMAGDIFPDVILMDLRLPGPMDGVETARRIREITRAPIIYLTAFSEVFVRNPSLMEEPCLCVAKPFALPDLLSVLRVALPQVSH